MVKTLHDMQQDL